MNRYIPFLFLFLLISCQKKSSYYSAEITLSHHYNTNHLEVIFNYENDSTTHAFIQKQKKGNFYIQGKNNHFLTAEIFLSDSIEPLTLYLKNGFHIQAFYADSLWMVEQEPGNNHLNNLENKTRQLFTEWYRLEKQKGVLPKPDSILLDIQTKMDNIELYIQKQAVQFLEQDTTPWVQMAIINNYLLSLDWQKQANAAIQKIEDEAQLLISPYKEMEKETVPLKTGSIMPDFGAATATDSVVHAFSLRGKYTVLFFESDNKTENDSIIKTLIDIQKSYSPSQLTILTISTNEDTRKWRQKQKTKKNKRWPELYLKEGLFNPAAIKLKLKQPPTLYLYDRSNKLVIQNNNPTFITAEIDKVLPKKRL